MATVNISPTGEVITQEEFDNLLGGAPENRENQQVTDIIGVSTGIVNQEGIEVSSDALLEEINRIKGGFGPAATREDIEEAALANLGAGKVTEQIAEFSEEVEEKRDPAVLEQALRDAIASGDEQDILDASADKLDLVNLEKSLEDTIEQADRLARELEKQRRAADDAGELLEIQVEDLIRDEDLIKAQQDKLKDDETRAEAALDRQQEALDIDLEQEVAAADKALRDIARSSTQAALDLATDLAAMGVAQSEIDAAMKGLEVEQAELAVDRADIQVANAALDEELASQSVAQADLDTARAELGEALIGLTVEQQDLIVAKKALGTRLAEQGVEQAAIELAQAVLGADLAELAFAEKEIDRSLTRLERAKSGAIRRARIAARVGAIRAAQATNAGAQGGFGASSAIQGLKAEATTAAAVAAGDMLTQLVDFGLKEESLHDEMGILDERGNILSETGELLLTREDLREAKVLQIEAEEVALGARGELLVKKGETLASRGLGLDARSTLLQTKAAVTAEKRNALDAANTSINARGDLIDAKGQTLLSRGELIEVQEKALIEKADLAERGFRDAIELLESTKESIIDKRALNSAAIEDRRDAIRDEFDILGIRLDDAQADIAAEMTKNGMDQDDIVEALKEIGTRQQELGTDKEEDIKFLIDVFDLGGSILEAKATIDRNAAASLKEDQERAQLIGNIAAVGGLVAVAGGGAVAIAVGAASAAVLTKLGIL